MFVRNAPQRLSKNNLPDDIKADFQSIAKEKIENDNPALVKNNQAAESALKDLEGNLNKLLIGKNIKNLVQGQNLAQTSLCEKVQLLEYATIYPQYANNVNQSVEIRV